MKQKLRFRGCYCPRRIQPIYLFLLATGLLLGSGWHNAFGQRKYTLPDTITPLRIGDTIPGWLWHLPLQVVNHPEAKDMITLNEYRGKLIILDFWATWCSACLDGFPKMDSLSTEFGDELAVILVNAKQTRDTPEGVAKAFERRKARIGYQVTLPYVVGDSIFQRVFPHRLIPHHVWINAAGVFRASTFADEVTHANVAALIAGSEPDMHTKRDVIGFDAMATPLAEIHAGLGAAVEFQSLLTGYIEGLGNKRGKTETSDGQTRIFSINASLGTLYNTVFSRERSGLPANRLVFDMPDAEGFRKKYEDYRSRGNKYCYELITPPCTDEQLERRMKLDLISRFNVSMERQSRTVNTLLLIPSSLPNGTTVRGRESVTATGDGTVLHNKTVRYLVNLLNNRVMTPIRCGTHDGERISITIPAEIAGYSDEELMQWFVRNGFSVRKESKELDFAVFKSAESK